MLRTLLGIGLTLVPMGWEHIKSAHQPSYDIIVLLCTVKLMPGFAQWIFMCI